jgi:hypothetical protein
MFCIEDAGRYKVSHLTPGAKLVSSASLKAALIGSITVWISVQKVAV